MGSSGFLRGIALRVAMLFATILAAAWVLTCTQWYATAALCILAAFAQAALLVRFATRAYREVAHLLDAIAVDDLSQSFSAKHGSQACAELGAAMSNVLQSLRAGRSEREEQAHYIRALLDHVPVALLSVDESGGVQLLNSVARRLFGPDVMNTGQFARYGDSFALGMGSLRPGSTATVRMGRASGSLQLKVTAVDLVVKGVRHHIVSLQNIEQEMSAQEMTAWQTAIRVMSHEVVNSLTPVSSLAGTAHELVRDVLGGMSQDDARAAALRDVREALETLARRSEGLLRFVQSHRRLTRRLETQPEITPVQRIFARLYRLLGQELAARGIDMTTRVEPETLEISVDADLLDQALINLVRNAIDALRDTAQAVIALSACRDTEGSVTITVADNGPGIAPDQREKVFVPFFTTKRQGTGLGLTIVRQIATAHSATVDISQAPGGGTAVSLHF